MLVYKIKDYLLYHDISIINHQNLQISAQTEALNHWLNWSQITTKASFLTGSSSTLNVVIGSSILGGHDMWVVFPLPTYPTYNLGCYWAIYNAHYSYSLPSSLSSHGWPHFQHWISHSPRKISFTYFYFLARLHMDYGWAVWTNMSNIIYLFSN